MYTIEEGKGLKRMLE